METEAAARALAASSRAAMTAPAGCGKTQVIATAVARFGTGRELILTHTHAGVDALRRRLVNLAASAATYHLGTIAGWALRLARSFPSTTGLPSEQPHSNDDYRVVYQAAAGLIRLFPIREILRASYTGVLVDEYQDCTVEQHQLVTSLAEVLPCRIVGDPLQGIFGFGDNHPVDWSRDVEDFFEPIEGPDTPWRWQASNPKLGSWLLRVRRKLIDGESIDLRNSPARWKRVRNDDPGGQVNLCLGLNRNDGETVVVIREVENRRYHLASRLKGRFSCIERVDVPDLFEFARALDKAEEYGRSLAVLGFAAKCMTKISTELKTIRSALENGRKPRIRRNREQLDGLLEVAGERGVEAINPALDVLSKTPRAIVYRRELLEEARRAVRIFLAGEAGSIEDAAWIVRNRTRRLGRAVATSVVGSTYLVKGLEFDHAIVFDADKYTVNNLYVAMTRGTKTLTVVSDEPVLTPRSTPSSP